MDVEYDPQKKNKYLLCVYFWVFVNCDIWTCAFVSFDIGDS